MNHPVLLVPHQELYLQSWKNFPDIRWHMLVTGFGGGKTRANVILTLMLVRELQGMKDRAGDGARLIVAGYTLAHLEKTFLLYFRSYLNTSKTEYREDTKNHICYIGTVTIIFLPMENPDSLFGEDAVACFDVLTKVLTKNSKGDIIGTAIGKLKEGDEVWTRKGWKKVLAVHDNGWKDCINVRGTWCTPDHKWSTGSDWIEARDISSETSLCRLDDEEFELCRKIERVQKKLSQMSKNLMGLDTTDTQTLIRQKKEIITILPTLEKAITQRCGKNVMDQYLLDAVCITRISTVSTTVSRIYSLLRELSIIESTQPNMSRKGGTSLTKEERQWLRQLKKHLSQGNVNGYVPCVEKLLSGTTARLSSALRSARKNAGSSCSSRGMSRNSDMRLCVDIVALCSGLLGTMLSSVRESAGMQTDMLKDSLQDRNLRASDASSAEKSSCGQEQDIQLLHAQDSAALRRESKRCHVYDITVEDCHEYFVGGSDAYYCVHNCIQEESDELPEATLIEACKALSERTRQQIIGFRSPFICLGTTSQGESGLYRLYCQFKKKGTGFVLIRGRTQDNFYLPKEQIVDLYKLYDETERRVFLEGEFLAVSRNRVFPGFAWDRNYMDDDMDRYIRPGERVYIAQDVNVGYSRASAWVAREGIMHCVKRYDFPDIADAPDIFRYDFPDQELFWIPDVTTKDSYPQFARALRRNNIHIIHRSKNPIVEDTAFLVSVLCKNSRIIFHKMARDAADAVARATRDKDGKIGKGKAPTDWQHDADTVRYACSYMALVLPEFRDIRQSLITHIASLRREVEKDEEKTVHKLSAGYIQIDPNAFFQRKH